MSNKQRLAAGVGMAIAVTFVASAGHAAPRLQWDTDGGAVSWHRACAFAHADPAPESPEAHRFVTLRGSLRSLAQGDAKLYAVFLDDGLDLDDLHELLDTAGAPPEWSNSTSGPVPTEWVGMGMNGAITLQIDEAHHPGNLVAVVNGFGEILGSHHLWNGKNDLAALHLD